MNARLNIADNLIALGRSDEADEHFKIVGRVVYEPSEPDLWMLWRYSQHFFHSLGELSLIRGEAREAIRLANECLHLAEETDVGKNVVKGLRLRAQAALALGDATAADRDLERALNLAIEIGNPGQLWKTYEARAVLRSTQGRADDARDDLHTALGILESMANGLSDMTLRDGLLTSRAVTRVRTAAAEQGR